MFLTLNMVVDHLKKCGQVRLASENAGRRQVAWVSLARHLTRESVEQNWLHVVSAADAPEFLTAHPQVLAVCVCELEWEALDKSSSDAVALGADAGAACAPAVTGELDASAPTDSFVALSAPPAPTLTDSASSPSDLLREFGDRVVVAETLRSPDEVFVCLRELFLGVGRWLDFVHLLFQQEGGYSEVLRSAEPVIGNFISLSDSAFRLLACTEGIDQDDPATTQLVALGYHSPQTVETFGRLNLPERWRSSTEFLEVVQNSPVCIYPTVSHVFKFKRSYFVHLVMLCNNRPITPGLLDSFSLLVEALTPFIERDWAARQRFSQPHDELFRELLSGSPLSEEALADRAAILGIPMRGRMCLCCIEVSRCDDVSLENVAWNLVDQLEGYRVSVFQERIVILSVQPDKPLPGKSPASAFGLVEGVAGEEGDVGSATFDFLQRFFLAGYVATVGESMPFSRLADLRDAYLQAVVALHYGGREVGTLYDSFRAPAYQGESRVVFHTFRDSFVNYLLFAPEKDTCVVEGYLARHALTRMLHIDEKNHTNVTDILLTYLACDRRATQAAQLLHMHRNNVAYHIDRIKAKYGLDLDDPSVRFELTLLSRFVVRTDAGVSCARVWGDALANTAVERGEEYGD